MSSEKIKRSFFIMSLLLLCASCNRSNKVFYEINGLTQGTTYHIVLEPVPDLDAGYVRIQVEELLASIDASLSTYSDTSVISMINSNISTETDTLLNYIVQLSARVWNESNGAFDITIGPLVKAWGFGPDAIRRFDESKLDSLMALVGMGKLHLENNTLTKEEQGMYIDVNAIAQGYTVDLIVDKLKSLGIENCVVEVGGEIGAVGRKNGKKWRVGLDTPIDGNNVPGAEMSAVINLSDISLATSGNYRKFYIENGVKYSHTINPATGYPVRHTLLSATILAKECAYADAWATACLVVGKDSAISFIENNRALEGYLIYSDEKGRMQTWVSPGAKNLFTGR